MITQDLVFVEYTKETCRSFTVNINSYWVTIRRRGEVVFKREPQNDSWLHPKHKAITEALAALEKALSAAVKVD